jgi:predicted RNase H-like HicB family nuclease
MFREVCLHPATNASPIERAEERGLTASRGAIGQQDELSIRTRSQKEEPTKYAVIIEAGEWNNSAYVSDLPDCIATGKTVEEVKRLIREGIAFHLEGLWEDGLPIMEPTTLAEYVEAEA